MVNAAADGLSRANEHRQIVALLENVVEHHAEVAWTRVERIFDVVEYDEHMPVISNNVGTKNRPMTVRIHTATFAEQYLKGSQSPTHELSDSSVFFNVKHPPPWEQVEGKGRASAPDN